MIDGPLGIRKLPRHWKTVAERAANENYTLTDLMQAIELALRNEIGKIPITDIVRNLDNGVQAIPFSDSESVSIDLC